ncbi:MAG: hypothetical protein GX339_05715 [Tissierellia bacterium]|nr:hypothetical protein [Tissierellia bacterium]
MHQKVKLISKRNQVYRVLRGGNTYILKKFNNIDSYKREEELLNLLKNAGVKVPSIIYKEENCLHIEDLGSFTLLDWYEDQEKSNTLTESMVYKLCYWLKDFYKAVYDYYNEELILQDVNFRNFLIFEDDIYGIDFEQVARGTFCQDIGRFSAYALTYDPVMTQWKINFRNKFINIMSKELNLDREKIISEEKKELLAIEKRRIKRRKI